MGDSKAAARRLEQALELSDLGANLYATRLKRENPALSKAEIDQMVSAWFRKRPGAEHGDADGRRVPWPRS